MVNAWYTKFVPKEFEENYFTIKPGISVFISSFFTERFKANIFLSTMHVPSITWAALKGVKSLMFQ